TNVCKEPESRVGVLASICAGLEVPFMVILGILSAKFSTRTLLILGGLFGGLFYFSIGVFNSLIMMIIGQVFLAIFLAILLGLGISYFQYILPDFYGYAFILFADAMVIGQLCFILFVGLLSHWLFMYIVF